MDLTLEKNDKIELRKKTLLSDECMRLLTQLSSDYVEFISLYDGCVGFINDNYIDLWSGKTICQLNPYFDWLDFSQQLILIGSNGSGTFYGYNLINKSFFEADEYFTALDETVNCGSTFHELLNHFSTKNYD